MSDTTIALDQTEEILACDVSDEALETSTGERNCGTLHTFLLHCFRSLPRPMSRKTVGQTDLANEQ